MAARAPGKKGRLEARIDKWDEILVADSGASQCAPSAAFGLVRAQDPVSLPAPTVTGSRSAAWPVSSSLGSYVR